jgi:hypothetical protein
MHILRVKRNQQIQTVGKIQSVRALRKVVHIVWTEVTQRKINFEDLAQARLQRQAFVLVVLNFPGLL